jgi:hypothetical protein
MAAPIQVPVDFDYSSGQRTTDRVVRDLEKTFERLGRSGKKNLRPLGEGLSAATASASEFDKSLAAANARVIAFGASAGIVVKVQQAFSALVKSTIDVEKSLKDINVILGASEKQLSKFGTFTTDFSQQNLKRVALGHNFLNLFHLCSDQVTELFGVPVVKLTFFQAEVFGTAKYFKAILNEAKHKPTEEMYQDPDLLIDWMTSNSGGKAEIEGKMDDKVAVSYVGATKEDLKDLGIDENDTISFSKEAAKKGGSLDMKDIMRMHGYKV